MNDLAPFNYAGIPVDAAQSVRDASTRIKVRMSRTAADIIEIGRDLIEVKRIIGHGNFLPWIDAEFGMSEQTARNLMQVAQLYGGKSPTVGDLSPTVLYALSAPSTSAEVREEVACRIDRGETVTAAVVKELKDKYKLLKSQHGAVLEYNSKLSGELRSKEQQIRFLDGDIGNLKEDVRRLTEPGTITIQPTSSDPQGETDNVHLMLTLWNLTPEDDQQEFLRRIGAA